MAANRTIYCLEKLTDYAEFERLSHDLMNLEGFKKIEPLGGFKDKGRDAVHVDNTQTTIFAYSVREDWRAKLSEDANKIEQYGHDCDQLIFVTTSNISAGRRDEAIQSIKQEYGWELQIYSQERLRILLEVEHPTVRENHPQIFTPKLFPKVQEDNSRKDKILIIFDDKDIIFTEWLIRKLTFEGYDVCTLNYSVSDAPVESNIKILIEKKAIAGIAVLSEEAFNNPKIIHQITLATELDNCLYFADLEQNSKMSISEMVQNPSVISFYTDWAKGLAILLKQLKEQDLPRNSTYNPKFATESFINNKIVSKEPEYVYSNTFQFKYTPSTLLKVDLHKKISNSNYDIYKYSWGMRYVNSATYLSFFHPSQEVEDLYRVRNIQLIPWEHKERVLGISTKNLISELLFKTIIKKCINKGLQKCEKSNLYYFPENLMENDKLIFERPDGSSSHVKYHGRRKYLSTNGISYYKYYIAPLFNIKQDLYDDFVVTLNIRYRFTDDHGRPLEGKTVNSRRKHLTSGWWNNHWLNRLLAVSQFLADTNYIKVKDPKDKDRVIIMNATPSSLLSPISIDEERVNSYPKDSTWLKVNSDSNSNHD